MSVVYIGQAYLAPALCFRLVCGRSRYVHGLPNRAHRWHVSMVCGVHFVLMAVHATHALLLTGVVFMISHTEPERKRSDG